jgi:hypothetical protein
VAPPSGDVGQGLAAPPYGVAGPWLSFVSALDSVSCRENRNFGLCFIQFRNISCVAFLKHKNSKKQETSTMASR